MPLSKPIYFKDTIAELLEEQLGTYTRKNGYVTPAIAVGNPTNDIKVEGLECIIPWFPYIPVSFWTYGQVHREEHWDIVLTLRSGNKLFEAADRITRYFPNTRSRYLPQNHVIGNYPQIVITIIWRDLYEGIT